MDSKWNVKEDSDTQRFVVWTSVRLEGPFADTRKTVGGTGVGGGRCGAQYRTCSVVHAHYISITRTGQGLWVLPSSTMSPSALPRQCMQA